MLTFFSRKGFIYKNRWSPIVNILLCCEKWFTETKYKMQTQDLFLTGTPEITYFKIVYRRHTNFATESIEIPFNDEVDFGKECLVTIPKAGDLINKVYF